MKALPRVQYCSVENVVVRESFRASGSRGQCILMGQSGQSEDRSVPVLSQLAVANEESLPAGFEGDSQRTFSAIAI